MEILGSCYMEKKSKHHTGLFKQRSSHQKCETNPSLYTPRLVLPFSIILGKKYGYHLEQPSKHILKTMGHLKDMSYTKNMVEMFNLKKIQSKMNLIIVFQYVYHYCEEEENNRYSLVMMYKTRGNAE